MKAAKAAAGTKPVTRNRPSTSAHSPKATSLLSSRHLTAERRAALREMVLAEMEKRRRNVLWMPIPNSPQERCLASAADIVFYGGSAGGGKGLSVDEVLPTPTGFRRMGDVHVGDVLFDKDGQACSVIAVTDTQYRRCFELEFDDGTTIIADDVH